MKENKTFYITTPIYYGNGLPHVGHFYSSTIANVIYKFHKISGYNSRFTTGIDENSQKAVIKAEEEGLEIMDYLDKMAEGHKKVWKHFNLDNTDFIRTTSKRHKNLVQKVLQHCFDKGDIYQGIYEGMYCIGCEAFKKDDDLINHPQSLLNKEGSIIKVCPDHLKKPDNIKEKNYFFKLSKYQTWMEEFYEQNPDFVNPKFRYNEVIAFTKRGLEDFSISRETNTFGIPLPFDETQVTYVWFDALFNYYTSCYSSRGGDKNKQDFIDETNFWETDEKKIHVVGKDIIRFHAIFWPAMLASYFDLGEEKDGILHYKKSDNKYLPTQVLTGGHFTVDGQKMSKSIGNIIEPVEYSKKYSKELLILYILSAFPIGNDGDYNRNDAILNYNAKLANNFGNLLNRVVVLSGKIGGELKIGQIQGTAPTDNYNKIFSKNLLEYNLKSALDESFIFLDSLNKIIDTEKPWELIKNNPEKAEEILYILAEGLRNVGLNLYSFFPEKMLELFERLGLENYAEQLENGKLEELRNKTEIFYIKNNGILFERFELPEESVDTRQCLVSTEKKINFSIEEEVKDLGLHVLFLSKIIEIPKIITRRNSGLKNYIKSELENIDFNNSQRLAIIEEAENFYKNNEVETAIHPSLHLQKLVENSGKLPNINNIVDSYNIESLKSGLSIGIHDISKIKGEEVVIKIATGEEKFYSTLSKRRDKN
ncbi:MAG: methionine--tRNA ligase [Candidatus Gracilibacteria bacterium]|nr:methionine--tRNA ligase [Candidatus Gracilibacteria bacterium]